MFPVPCDLQQILDGDLPEIITGQIIISLPHRQCSAFFPVGAEFGTLLQTGYAGERFLGELQDLQHNYDSLLLAHPYDKEMVEGIFNLILETVLSKNEEITIAGDVYPKNLVKSKFLKLNYSHVEYVINCLGKNTTKVRNIKSYLLASLFNAGSTISSYYRAEVNHDMPQFAG